MNELELLQSLHTLNDSERFYLQYQMVKKDPSAFRHFLRELDVAECVRKHYVIPELAETMPEAMRDEYFFSDPQIGMVISKHNCYSPVFQHFHTYFEAFYVFEGSCWNFCFMSWKGKLFVCFFAIPNIVPTSVS